MFKKILITIAIFLLTLAPVMAAPADSLTITITPPLIKNSMAPGQAWRSAVKVVNNNTQELKIYMHVMDFQGGAEDGTVEFIDPNSETGTSSDHLLSRWLEIESGPVTIPAGQSADVPFTIIVPDSAEPGGHYAAILAGTNPPDDKVSGSVIRVSSLLATLLLVSVKGDTKEDGAIREFSSDREWYTQPDAKFTVRFENKGNVHIQPQGVITIYDWRGREKGSITINHYTEFGNVLPGGIRRWEYDWQGEAGLLDNGRYRAELILTYGEEGRQTVSQTIYFWVVDIVPLAVILGSILFFILMIIFIIRLYVRRAIKNTREMADLVMSTAEKPKKMITVLPESGHTLDLKAVVRDNTGRPGKTVSPPRGWRILRVALILAMLALIGAGGAIAYWYYQDTRVSTPPLNGENNKMSAQETYQAQTSVPGTDDSPETAPAAAAAATTTEAELAGSMTETVKPDIPLAVLNGSGQTGAANLIADELAASGYTVGRTGNADRFTYTNTVIRYTEDKAEAISALQDIFIGTVELESVKSGSDPITVIVGRLTAIK